MAQVKTLIEHMNGYGDTPLKKKGKKYDHPNPQAEVQAGLVELVVTPAAKKAADAAAKKKVDDEAAAKKAAEGAE